MTRTLFNFFAVSLLAIAILAGLSFFAAYQTPGIARDNATVFFHLVQYFILLSPLLPILPSAFFFANAELEGRSVMDHGLRGVASVFALLLLAGSLQFFAGDRILEYFFEKHFEKQKAAFVERVSREIDLEGLRSFYEKDKPGNAAKTLETLQSISRRFPFEIPVERFRDRVVREEWQRVMENGAPAGNKKLRDLENIAIELRNRREFEGAAKAYEKCLALIPDQRALHPIRERYELGYELNLRLDRDPSIKQSDDELKEEILRKKLLDVDETLKRGDIYGAFVPIRDLFVEHEKQKEVSERFLRVESEIRGKEFLVQDYLQWLEFCPKTLQLGKQRFQFGPYSVQADRFVLGFKAVYLENAVVEAPGKKWSFRYARVLGNQVQFKNREFEKSESLAVAQLDTLHRLLPYFLPEYRHLLYFMGPWELRAFGKFSKSALAQNEFPYRLYAEAKTVFPLGVLAFSIFFITISYRNRLHVIGPVYLLFVPLATALFLFLEAVAIYSLTTFGEWKAQPLLFTALLWATQIAFLIYAMTFLARSRAVDSVE